MPFEFIAEKQGSILKLNINPISRKINLDYDRWRNLEVTKQKIMGNGHSIAVSMLKL